MAKQAKTTQQWLFLALITLVLILGTANIAKAKGWLIPEQQGVRIQGDRIWLDSLSIEQKVAQMVIAAAFPENRIALKNIGVGGIHLYARQTEHIYNNTIIDFQYQQPIPFFVTADLEGCITPFGHLREFPANTEIATIGEAFEKGFEEGRFLNTLGFTLNFAPVVDLDDLIWNCRAFPGNETHVAQLAQAYILGLQDQGIIATAKHYPGKTLAVRDPHKYIVAALIDDRDIFPYRYLWERGAVRAIMVSHIISSGEVDSRGMPAVVSSAVIAELREHFDGLIISDEIHMLGLKDFFDTVDEMYIAVFAAGNDIILNFDKDPLEVYRMILVVADAVKNGEIQEEQIDASVTKILEAKGFTVK